MMADEFGRIIRCASTKPGTEILLDLSEMPGAVLVLHFEHQSVRHTFSPH